MFQVKCDISDCNVDFNATIEANEINATVECDNQEINMGTVISTGGTYDHSKLFNRNIENAHTMDSIVGLQKELEETIKSDNALTNLDLESLLK